MPGVAPVRPPSFRNKRGSLKGSFRGSRGNSFRGSIRTVRHGSTKGSFRGSFRAIKQNVPPNIPARAVMKPKIETRMVRDNELIAKHCIVHRTSLKCIKYFLKRFWALVSLGLFLEVWICTILIYCTILVYCTYVLYLYTVLFLCTILIY